MADKLRAEGGAADADHEKIGEGSSAFGGDFALVNILREGLDLFERGGDGF